MTEPASKNKAFVAGASPSPRPSPGEGRAHGVLISGDPVPPPTTIESMIPVFGPMVEAGYEFNHDHPLTGVADMGLAVADGLTPTEPATWGARVVGDAMRRGLEKQLALSWTRRAVRGRLQTAGLVRKGALQDGVKIAAQELHHGVIPHGGWGKFIPDQIKNASWNLKVLEQETHRRIHGAFKGLPRFNPIKRTWVGTPDHVKKVTGIVMANAAKAGADHIEGKSHVR